MNEIITGYFDKKYIEELLIDAGKGDLLEDMMAIDLDNPRLQLITTQLSIALAFEQYEGGSDGDVAIFRRQVFNPDTEEFEERVFLIDMSDNDERAVLSIVNNELEEINQLGKISGIGEYLDKLVKI